MSLLWKYKWLSGFFITFSVAYVAQALLVAPDQETLTKYHISSGQAIGLALTVAIPYLLIWFIALGGFLRLKDYITSIRGGKDGEAFLIIGHGILLLTLWLPLSAVFGGFATHYYQSHPSATADMVRLTNYITLAILFPAFWLINRGAHRLLSLVKRPSYQFPQMAIVACIGLAALYVFLTLSDPARQVPVGGVKAASYYLPDWATVTTIVIPRLIMWFLGIQAIYFIYLYRHKVKGALYRGALRNLANGLGWVVITTIVLRMFQSFSTQLSDLNLGLLLLIVYFLLIIIGAGYVLIAKGAKSLQRIEEI